MHPEASQGEHVLLVVSDTGCGMDRATLQRIFEPFFTTKAEGHGTGLGLATVYGIVKQFNGHVTVYSEVNVGTTFKVYLPAVREAAAASAPRQAVLPVGRGERLLICEDDRGLRQLVSKVLSERGYEVLAAGQPTDAITLADQDDRPIPLLITDVIMAGMNGPQLAEHLRKRRPHLKVLYTSGYTKDVVLRQGLLEAGVEFLPKPFTPDDLLQRVRTLLDAPPEA
jgi:CheY-like chemotaxis protein